MSFRYNVGASLLEITVFLSISIATAVTITATSAFDVLVSGETLQNAEALSLIAIPGVPLLDMNTSVGRISLIPEPEYSLRIGQLRQQLQDNGYTYANNVCFKPYKYRSGRKECTGSSFDAPDGVQAWVPTSDPTMLACSATPPLGTECQDLILAAADRESCQELWLCMRHIGVLQPSKALPLMWAG